MIALTEFILRPSVTILLLFIVFFIILMIGAWGVSFFYSELKGKRASGLDVSGLSWIEESALHSELFKKVLMLINFILISGLIIYYYIDNTSMQGHVMEWLNLIIRWAHMIFGIIMEMLEVMDLMLQAGYTQVLRLLQI